MWTLHFQKFNNSKMPCTALAWVSCLPGRFSTCCSSDLMPTRLSLRFRSSSVSGQGMKTSRKAVPLRCCGCPTRWSPEVRTCGNSPLLSTPVTRRSPGVCGVLRRLHEAADIEISFLCQTYLRSFLAAHGHIATFQRLFFSCFVKFND